MNDIISDEQVFGRTGLKKDNLIIVLLFTFFSQMQQQKFLKLNGKSEFSTLVV